MKCKRCRGAAVVEVRRHNAAFCSACFVHHVHEQVKRAVKSYEMLEPKDRVLVCVSGGKDSLGLWDVLLELGYPATGMYLGLGIGEYSDRSAEVTRATSATSTGSTSPPQARRGPARPARCAGCPSGTCSIGWRSTMGSMS
jgi:hypothetical protein